MNRSASARVALVATIAIAAFLAAPSTLSSQEDPKPLPRIEGVRAAAYPLAHADPREVAGILLALFEAREPAARITGDPRTNTLIVFATDGVHRHVQDLLATLDKEVGGGQGEEETRIIRVQHHPVDSLTAVAGLHAIEFALGRATNSFIVRGRSAELDRFAATIAALDIDTPAIELEGWVLEKGRGDAVEQSAELGALAPELARAGLAGYGASSRWSIRSLAGEKFRSSQKFDNRRISHLAIGGTVRLVDEGRNAQIELEVQLRGYLADATAERPEPQIGSFEVETTIETQPGKLVVLGLAPTGDDQSPPIAIVVRVRP